MLSECQVKAGSQSWAGNMQQVVVKSVVNAGLGLSARITRRRRVPLPLLLPLPPAPANSAAPPHGPACAGPASWQTPRSAHPPQTAGERGWVAVAMGRAVHANSLQTATAVPYTPASSRRCSSIPHTPTRPALPHPAPPPLPTWQMKSTSPSRLYRSRWRCVSSSVRS